MPFGNSEPDLGDDNLLVIPGGVLRAELEDVIFFGEDITNNAFPDN